MSYIITFTLIFAIIVTSNAQNQCNSEVCNNICQAGGLNGTCQGNDCDCSFNKSCLDVVCDFVCDQLDLGLEGECDDNNFCICKAKLEVCPTWDCEEQCLEDIRAEECIAEGGVVTPDWCLDYAKIQTCGCLCTILNEVKHFLPVKAKKSFYRYNTMNLPFYTGKMLKRNHYQITSSQSQPTVVLLT